MLAIFSESSFSLLRQGGIFGGNGVMVSTLSASPTSTPTTGDDVIIGFPFPASRGIDGLAGFDLVDFSQAPGAVTTTLSATGSASVRIAGVTSTLSIRNIEGLIGSAFADNLTGSSGDNWFHAGDGSDVVSGGSGSDTIAGGAGNDTLNGGADADLLSGDAGDDVLTGGAGVDTMAGGAGDDIYNVDDSGDVVTELANEGIDTVKSLVSFTLSENVERLTLLGSVGIDGYGNASDNLIVGNTGDNFIFGAGGADTLRGLGGADSLDGDAGNDSLDGGAGDDYLFGGSDVGADTLVGGDGDDQIDGGAGNDSLRGDAGADIILGGDGVDTIEGAAGNDILFGQGGADTFVFRTGFGADRINDFEIGTDKIRLLGLGISDFTQLKALFVQNGSDSAIVISADTKITLQDIDFTQLSAGDFLFR